MRFSHARRTHKQKAFFAGTGIITDESLRDEFYLLERLCMLCRPDFSIGEISDVTFKVAMLERHRRTSIRACAANGKPRRMWICVKEKKTDATESLSCVRTVERRMSFEVFKSFGRQPRRMDLSLISSGGCAWGQSRAATASHWKCDSQHGKAPVGQRSQTRSFVFPFRASSRACSE